MRVARYEAETRTSARILDDGDDASEAKDELHKTFAVLSQEEQKFANIFLHDIQSGNVKLKAGKTFRDYITEYRTRARDDRIHNFAESLGLDETALRAMMRGRVTEANINEFGRFDALKKTLDATKAKAYIEALEGKKLPLPIVNVKADKLLREFVLNDA